MDRDSAKLYVVAFTAIFGSGFVNILVAMDFQLFTSVSLFLGMVIVGLGSALTMQIARTEFVNQWSAGSSRRTNF